MDKTKLKEYIHWGKPYKLLGQVQEYRGQQDIIELLDKMSYDGRRNLDDGSSSWCIETWSISFKDHESDLIKLIGGKIVSKMKESGYNYFILSIDGGFHAVRW